VEDVVRVIHDMSIFVILATCCKELDAVSRIRGVDVARYKRKLHDLVADLGWEQGVVDLVRYWRSRTRHGGALLVTFLKRGKLNQPLPNLGKSLDRGIETCIF